MKFILTTLLTASFFQVTCAQGTSSQSMSDDFFQDPDPGITLRFCEPDYITASGIEKATDFFEAPSDVLKLPKSYDDLMQIVSSYYQNPENDYEKIYATGQYDYITFQVDKRYILSQKDYDDFVLSSDNSSSVLRFKPRPKSAEYFVIDYEFKFKMPNNQTITMPLSISDCFDKNWFKDATDLQIFLQQKLKISGYMCAAFIMCAYRDQNFKVGYRDHGASSEIFADLEKGISKMKVDSIPRPKSPSAYLENLKTGLSYTNYDLLTNPVAAEKFLNFKAPFQRIQLSESFDLAKLYP